MTATAGKVCKAAGFAITKITAPCCALTEAQKDALNGWIQAYGLQSLADVAGIINGFQQGGVEGGVFASLDAAELATSLEHLFGTEGFALTGEGMTIAIVIGVAIGLAALIFGGNHDDPKAMPDKYDTVRYTQYVGELQGQAATGYAPPYDPSSDPIQIALGGQPELAFIQDWVRNNLSSSNSEVQREAEKLLPLYGTSGSGKLSFGHDIANESVTGGSESGTYISIHDDAGQAVSEIELLYIAFPTQTNLPPPLQSPAEDYGGLAWVPFVLPTGDTGYWAPKGDGTYYYFGPDGTLYHDSYKGEVQSSNVGSNAVGNVGTFNFDAADGTDTATNEYPGDTYYAGLYA